MKLNRTKLFIIISSLALLIVLIIQVNWIFQTAKAKEELFNEKANMVLSSTAEALSSDTVTCRNMESCIGKNEIHKTDSLFTNYMKYYNFHIDYSFDVRKPNAGATVKKNDLSNSSYKKRLDEEASKSGLELNLFLPEKRQFIIEEMGTLFITSIILIIAVLIMFWKTILLLIKEKKISEHTNDFLNNMTHELKTPLTNIALASKMIMKDSANHQDNRIRHYSEIILEENEKLRLQVEQVLSMTALEIGEIPIKKDKINFHQLIHDSLKYINIQIENKQGNCRLNLEAKNFKIFGDATHLTNVICNLIDNALKYSLVKPELSIRTSNIDGKLICEIEDSGVGIEKEYQKKVFEKYFRVPTGNVHDVKGFGLGLAYVKKIVELHGGTIQLKSEREYGTTFSITLKNA